MRPEQAESREGGDDVDDPALELEVSASSCRPRETLVSTFTFGVWIRDLGRRVFMKAVIPIAGRSIMKKLILVTLLLVIPVIGPAQTPSTAARSAVEAANMPLETRLARRFDPATIKALRSSTSQLEGAVTISGKEHPEFFTPAELTRNLIGMAIIPTNPKFREHMQAKFLPVAVRLGLGSDFFSVVESQVTEYAVARRAGLAQPVDKTDSATLLRECATTAQALRNLRATFGKNYDVFLYEAVAPGLITESRDTIEEVRALEGGCQ